MQSLAGDQQDSLDKAYTTNSPVLGSRGWRMAVHEPNTLPAMFDEGFDILPGMSTSISLSSNTFVYFLSMLCKHIYLHIYIHVLKILM